MPGDKNDPNWKPKEVKTDKPAQIKLCSSKPISSGKNKWGDWFLWPIEVTNATVYDKNTGAEIKGYTGKATMFPTANMSEQFSKIINGKENSIVEISATLKETNDGKPYKVYDVKLVREGETPSHKVSGYSQLQYLTDYEKHIADGIMDDEYEHFEFFGAQKPYSLDVENLKKLWEIHQQKKNK